MEMMTREIGKKFSATGKTSSENAEEDEVKTDTIKVLVCDHTISIFFLFYVFRPHVGVASQDGRLSLCSGGVI
jgi:hypothetical protein